MISHHAQAVAHGRKEAVSHGASQSVQIYTGRGGHGRRTAEDWPDAETGFRVRNLPGPRRRDPKGMTMTMNGHGR